MYIFLNMLSLVTIFMNIFESIMFTDLMVSVIEYCVVRFLDGVMDQGWSN